MASSSARRASRAPASRGRAASKSRVLRAGRVPRAACMAADVGTSWKWCPWSRSVGHAPAKAVA
eukprot:1111002-Alexandrium_andersonii.AAC.1